jgi:lysophospholipase L1-like esterase
MKVLLLGDSISEGFDLNTFFPEKKFENHGKSGFSSAELLEAMQPGWFSNQPEIIFLCIGTNDLARNIDVKEILGNIQQLILKIREFLPTNPIIYITSLFPTRHNPPRPNHLIDQFNLYLHSLANEAKIQYLHLNPFFKDANGQLRKTFTKDGLHLSSDAYQVWTSILMTFIDNPEI